ncbi:MAG: hypothetical protein QXD29_06030 [Thermoplasmata archaeon]
MYLIIKNGKIFSNGNEVGNIVYKRRFINFTISGIVNVEIKKNFQKVRIFENNLQVGNLKRMRINYMGRPYELEKGGFSKMMSMRNNSVNIISLGTPVGKIGWENGSIFVDSEGEDLTVSLIYASIFSFYAKANIRNLPNPYRKIYFSLSISLYIYIIIIQIIILMGYFPINIDLIIVVIVVAIAIMLSEIVIMYLGRRKKEKYK